MASVCVVGAGAIGGIIAARMALAGHQVSVVARGAHLQAIRDHGLLFDDRVGGGQHRLVLPASDTPGAFGHQDLVVIGLKGPAIPSMLPAIAPLVGPDTMVVPAINGIPWWYFFGEGSAVQGSRIACLDPDDTLFGALAPAHIVGCVVLAAGEVSEPGRVVHTAMRQMVVGEPTNQVSERATRLARWWNASGFETRVSASIRADIWWKLTGNLSFNTVSALTGYRTDQLIDDPALVELLCTLIDETRSVAGAYGVTVDGDARQRIERARVIGRARSSTLQDVEAGRRPEIEGLVGAVIELAGRADVPVPTIRHVAALLTARARHLGLIPSPTTHSNG